MSVQACLHIYMLTYILLCTCILHTYMHTCIVCMTRHVRVSVSVCDSYKVGCACLWLWTSRWGKPRPGIRMNGLSNAGRSSGYI